VGCASNASWSLGCGLQYEHRDTLSHFGVIAPQTHRHDACFFDVFASSSFSF
jgi:hypothetical protein